MVKKPLIDGVELHALGLEQLAEKFENGVLVVEARVPIGGTRTCPGCGRAGSVTATRQSRYADIPRDGHPVVLAWRRRLFACRSCGKAFREQLPALAEGRRVTRRLAEWLAHQATKRTFLDIAAECGLSQRTVLSLLRSPDDWTVTGAVPPVLGLALVPLAGLPRPVVIDVGTASVIDVYRSVARLQDQLRHWGEVSAGIERVILDIGLDPVSAEINAAFGKAERLADPASAARVGAAMMLASCREAIAVNAKRENLAVRTLNILFNKDEASLGRVGRRRLLFSVDGAGALLKRAYKVKEDFVRHVCPGWFAAKWSEWRRAAKGLCDDEPAGGPSINYGEVLALFDRYSPALERYAQAQDGYSCYEKLLTSLRALPKTGTRSFKGTRAAILQKFGGGGNDDETSEEQSS